jgi:16S rRNA (cytosine1402-N4)-methyltransferase
MTDTHDHPAADLHVPVLLDTVVEQLRPRAGLRMLDCTLGMGGHSAALLARGASVVGVDRDGAARALAAGRLLGAGERFELRAGTFADVAEAAVKAGEHFDGVLADLGVSSLQLDDGERGFSMRSPVLADMRMDRANGETAIELIDRLDEYALADVIYKYGEERLSRRIARALKLARSEGVATGEELAAVVRKVVPGHHPRHPATRTFQALRIAVNDELGQLERLLALLPELLTPVGRVVIMSFHSLEDRLVKQALRAHREAGRLGAVANRVMTATDAELAANPRAGAAKLRWAAKIDDRPAYYKADDDDANDDVKNEEKTTP